MRIDEPGSNGASTQQQRNQSSSVVKHSSSNTIDFSGGTRARNSLVVVDGSTGQQHDTVMLVTEARAQVWL